MVRQTRNGARIRSHKATTRGRSHGRGNGSGGIDVVEDRGPSGEAGTKRCRSVAASTIPSAGDPRKIGSNQNEQVLYHGGGRRAISLHAMSSSRCKRSP